MVPVTHAAAGGYKYYGLRRLVDLISIENRIVTTVEQRLPYICVCANGTIVGREVSYINKALGGYKLQEDGYEKYMAKAANEDAQKR